MYNKFFVYLLRSLKDNRFYIGQTHNVSLRLEHHNAGRVKSTKSRTPFVLVGYEEYGKRNEATWREYELKNNSNKRKEFITKLSNKGMGM